MSPRQFNSYLKTLTYTTPMLQAWPTITLKGDKVDRMRKGKMQVTKRRAIKALKEVVKILNFAQGSDVKGGEHRQEPHAQAFREVITFLRGPDSADYKLKQVTTARVRGVLGVSRNSGLHTDEGAIISVEDIMRNHPMDFQWQRHHQQHYERAVKALAELGIVAPS